MRRSIEGRVLDVCTPCTRREDHKVMSIIILCLVYKVLREIARNKTTIYMWVKLESFLMVESKYTIKQLTKLSMFEVTLRQYSYFLLTI